MPTDGEDNSPFILVNLHEARGLLNESSTEIDRALETLNRADIKYFRNWFIGDDTGGDR